MIDINCTPASCRQHNYPKFYRMYIYMNLPFLEKM
jgi:hypothetical protein